MSDLLFSHVDSKGKLTFELGSESEKLTTLTKILRNIEETPDKTECKDLIDSGFVNQIRCTLKPTESKFVLYMAQKALTTYIKRTCCQDGLSILQEILIDSTDTARMSCGLQICRNLLSKDCFHRYHIFKMLSTSIYEVFMVPFTSTCLKNLDLGQHFYESCSILVKIAKMFLSFNVDECLSRFIKQILSSEFLCKILFHTSLKHYVKSKLIQFLCLILKPHTVKDFKSIQQEKLTTSTVVFQQLCSRDVRSVYLCKGTRTFIGVQNTDINYDDADDINVNLAHIREWTLLAFSIASCLVNYKENVSKVMLYLSEMDIILQKTLKMKSTIPYPWLPDVYSDQDDVWIDVLLLLIDIYSMEDYTCENSSYRWQHHMHFLKFVGILGYDHLVLIDLLTSPETNCLLYFTKYLKILQTSWSDFVYVTKLLKDEKYDTGIDEATSNTYDMVATAPSKHEVIENESNDHFVVKCPTNSCNLVEEAFNDCVEVQPTLNDCVKIKITLKDEDMHKSTSKNVFVHSSCQKSAGNLMDLDTPECENEMEADNLDHGQNDSQMYDNIPTMQTANNIEVNRSMKTNMKRDGNKMRSDSVCKSGGLSLLADAYDDDSDDSSNSDNDDEDNINEAINNLKSHNDENSDTIQKENYSRLNNDVAADNVNIECDVTVGLNVDKLNVNDCVVDDLSVKFEDNDDEIFNGIKSNDIEGDNFDNTNDDGNDKNETNDKCNKDVDFCDDDFGCNDDDDNDDDFDIEEYRRIMKDLNDETVSNTNTDNEILDKTMSMLIRTRFKLEALRDSNIIMYNPNVFIHLISSIEVIYENV